MEPTYNGTGLVSFWETASKPWSLNTDQVFGVSNDHLESMLFNHTPTLNELRLFDEEGIFPATMYGDSGNDIMFGSSLPDQMYGGSGRDFLTNPPGSEICLSLSCNHLNGEADSDFIHGAGSLIGLNDFGADVVLPIFSTPIIKGQTKYFTNAFDMCFTIEGYPVSNFTNTPCGIVLEAYNLPEALNAYRKWLLENN